MMARDQIRAQLKAAGYNARQVSIRVRGRMDTSIYATIRDLAVDPATVRRICEAAGSVARCEMTGEILCGGNTYVHVEWAEGLLEGFASDVVAALKAGETIDWNGWHVAPKCGDEGYFIAERIVPRIGEASDDVCCWGVDLCARLVAERVLVARAAASSTLVVARRALHDEAAALREAQAELDYLLAESDLDAPQLQTATEIVHERAGLVRNAAAALVRAERAAGTRRVAA